LTRFSFMQTLGLLALGTAQPVLAQDADPANQLVEGYVVCIMAKGDAEVATANLGLYGWTHEEAEDGLQVALPGVGGDTFVLMANDGSFCQVESMTLGTDKAAETLGFALPGAGISDPVTGTDEMGCTTMDLGNGLTATLTSGGNDPTCTSDTDSAVRFNFAAD